MDKAEVGVIISCGEECSSVSFGCKIRSKVGNRVADPFSVPKLSSFTFTMTRKFILPVSRGSLPNTNLSFYERIRDYFFPRSVLLYQHLFSFIRKYTILRYRIV